MSEVLLRVLNNQIHKSIFAGFLVASLITIPSFFFMSTTSTKFLMRSPVRVGQKSSDLSQSERLIGSPMTESLASERGFGNSSRSVEQEYLSTPISFNSLQRNNSSGLVSLETQDTQIVKLALQILGQSPSNSNWLCIIVLNQAYLGLFENWMCSLHRFKATEVVMPLLPKHITYMFLTC